MLFIIIVVNLRALRIGIAQTVNILHFLFDWKQVTLPVAAISTDPTEWQQQPAHSPSIHSIQYGMLSFSRSQKACDYVHDVMEERMVFRVSLLKYSIV